MFATSEFKLGFDENARFTRVINASIKISTDFEDGSISHEISIRDEKDNEIYYLNVNRSHNQTEMRTYISVSLYNGESFTIDQDWYAGSVDASPLVNFINNHIAQKGVTAPLNLIMRVTTYCGGSDPHNDYPPISELSQAIFELECETGINVYKKDVGVVKAATTAYRKLGGSWAEIPEEEAKDILKNNIITQGGS
jgi:hypothetical protein